MKVTIIICSSFLITLLGCKSSKPIVYPEYVIGLNNNYSKKLISSDSLHIVTPNIEIYNVHSYSSEPDYDKRKIIRQNIEIILKAELPHAVYFKLPLMEKDYLSVNKVLESILHVKWKHPNWVVQAPKEILVTDKKYTLLINLTGHYGKRKNAFMSFTVINNTDKIIESVNIFEFNNTIDKMNYKKNPLDINLIRKKIKSVLPNLIYIK